MDVRARALIAWEAWVSAHGAPPGCAQFVQFAEDAVHRALSEGRPAADKIRAQEYCVFKHNEHALPEVHDPDFCGQCAAIMHALVDSWNRAIDRAAAAAASGTAAVEGSEYSRGCRAAKETIKENILGLKKGDPHGQGHS